MRQMTRPPPSPFILVLTHTPLLSRSPLSPSLSIIKLLDERSPDALDEVVNQIAFADTILLNKIDLVSQEDLQHARDLVRSVNVTANLIECQLKDSDVADGAIAPGAPPGSCPVTWDTVMDVNSFSIERALQVDPTFMDDSANREGGEKDDDGKDGDDEEEEDEAEEEAAGTAGRDGQPGTGGPPSTRARSRSAAAAATASGGGGGGGGGSADPKKRGRGSHGASPDAAAGGGGSGGGGDTKKAAGAMPAAQRWRRQSLHDLAGVSSVGISATGPLDQYRFNMFMKDLLLEKARDIMRCKGVLCIHGQEGTRFVFQGVHDTVCFGPSAQGWDPASGPPISQIVFIGRNLDRAMLSEGFRSCVWTPLPPGWTEHLDARSGRPYFVCPSTGSKQWTRPTSGGAAEGGVEVTEAPLRPSLEGGGKVASPVAGAPQA